MNGTESRYHEIFEHAPVALFAEDFSGLIAALDMLRSEGVTDIGAHLDEHPGLVRELVAKIAVVDVNQHAVDFYRAGSKQELLSSIAQIFDPDAIDACKKQLVSLAGGERLFQAESYARTLDGRRLRVLLQIKVLGDDRRRGLRSVIDISERKQLEDSLRETSAALARSHHELTEFTYVASHDLQEPLRVISSYAQLFDKRYGEQFDERANKYLNYIVDASKRMQDLVGDLLRLSRVGTQGAPLQPVALGDVVADAVSQMRTGLQEIGAQVECSELPTISGDVSQLGQLFHNLLANAIKFCNGRPLRVSISAQRHDDTWRIAVADNGIGIDPKYADEIFTAFRRLHSRTQYPGTGMGLAIVKKIVDRHKGRIWVESELARGSTFYIEFPATGSDIGT